MGEPQALQAAYEALYDTWHSWVEKIHWRSDRLPTPVLWPGESHGLYSPQGHKDLDTTEGLPFTYTLQNPRLTGKQVYYSDFPREIEPMGSSEERLLGSHVGFAFCLCPLPSL